LRATGLAAADPPRGAAATPTDGGGLLGERRRV